MLFDQAMAQENTGWRPRESPTRKDWDIHLPILRQIYLKEQRTLEDVMRIMEQKLGFVATKKVYKTNFNRLLLFKNRTKTSNKASGAANTPINEAPPTDSTTAWNALFERTYAQAIAPSACQPATEQPMRSLSGSGIDRCSETVLWHIAILSETWLEARKCSPSLFTRTSITWQEIFGQSFVPLALFDMRQGLQALDQACDTIKDLISHGSHNLLPMLLVEFCCKWSHFPDVRRSLLRFLTTLAVGVLGIQHPLSVILFNLIDENVAALCTDSALQIAAHAAEREQPAIDYGLLRLKHAYCCRLIDSEQYQAALAPTLWLYSEAKKAYGAHSELARCALLRKGEINIGLGEIQEANIIYKEVLQVSENTQHHSHLDAVGVEAATRIAKLRLVNGDVVGAHQFCERALRTFWCSFSPRGLMGMGLTLKIMLDEILVTAEASIGAHGQNRGLRSQPGDVQSSNHDCQVPSTKVIAISNLNACVSTETPRTYPAARNLGQNTRLGTETLCKRRDKDNDPFVANFTHIMRQSANPRSHKWKIRPFIPPGY